MNSGFRLGHSAGRPRPQLAFEVLPGQSLLELVVAIFVIITALTGIASLVTVTVRGQEQSEETVIAYNLAREGVEMVRALRDNTFTSGNRSASCTSNCKELRQNLGDHDGIPQLVNVSAPYDVDLVLNYDGSLSDFTSRGNELCLKNTGSAFYYYQRYNVTNTNQSCTLAEGTLTRFKRRVTVDYVCLNPGTNAECVATGGAGCPGTNCAGYTQLVGHRVQSRVQFRGRRGLTQEVVLEDYLYGWK